MRLLRRHAEWLQRRSRFLHVSPFFTPKLTDLDREPGLSTYGEPVMLAVIAKRRFASARFHARLHRRDTKWLQRRYQMAPTPLVLPAVWGIGLRVPQQRQSRAWPPVVSVCKAHSAKTLPKPLGPNQQALQGYLAHVKQHPPLGAP